MPPSLPVVGQRQHSGFVAFENMIPPLSCGWAGCNVEDLDSPWPCQRGDNLAAWQRCDVVLSGATLRRCSVLPVCPAPGRASAVTALRRWERGSAEDSGTTLRRGVSKQRRGVAGVQTTQPRCDVVACPYVFFQLN